MQTLRYGLIGCGMMGQEHMRNIELLPGAEVVAIFEPNPNMAMRAKAMAPDARIYPSLDRLLAHDPLDALIIASPNDCHMAQLELIAAVRPLPVMVEKPVFSHAGERRRAIDFTESYAPPVWVAMEYRFMPPIALLIEEADAVTGGVKMLSIREHRFPFLAKVGGWNRLSRRTGGTLVEKCCHFFDLMRLILRDEPVRVTASADQAVNHLDERMHGERADMWDNAFVCVDFSRGARAMLDLCMFAEGSTYQEEITAIGARGKIEARAPGPARFWPAELGVLPDPEIVVSPREPKGPRRRAVPVDPALLAAGDHNGSTYYQHALFLKTLREGAEPVVTMQDGIRAVDLALAAQDAAVTGEAIRLEIPPEHRSVRRPA